MRPVWGGLAVLVSRLSGYLRKTNNLSKTVLAKVVGLWMNKKISKTYINLLQKVLAMKWYSAEPALEQVPLVPGTCRFFRMALSYSKFSEKMRICQCLWTENPNFWRLAPVDFKQLRRPWTICLKCDTVLDRTKVGETICFWLFTYIARAIKYDTVLDWTKVGETTCFCYVQLEQ